MSAVDVAIIGGCGHVGLPLGLSFAEAGVDVVLFDVNANSVRSLHEGTMPFVEDGGAQAARGPSDRMRPAEERSAENGQQE